MPYIITTSNPTLRAAFDEAGGRGVDLAERIDAAESRTAVATLDEARAEIRYRIDTARQDMRGAGDEREAWANARAFLGISIERGGTVGPLPDGTVIEVRRVTDGELASLAGWPAPPLEEFIPDLIAEFNGAHA